MASDYEPGLGHAHHKKSMKDKPKTHHEELLMDELIPLLKRKPPFDYDYTYDAQTSPCYKTAMDRRPYKTLITATIHQWVFYGPKGEAWTIIRKDSL